MERLGLGRFAADGGLTGVMGRNDNWAGRTESGREVFVKRIGGEGPHARARFDRLCAFEAALAGTTPSGWRAPVFLGGDRDALVLAFERLEGGRAGHHVAEDGEFDAVLARRAGRAVAEVHELAVRRESMEELRGAGLPGHIRALTLQDYAGSSFAELEAWALIHHDKGLNRALAALRERSDAASRVPSHCDLRLDQFLLVGEELYLTDWEEFRLADPAHDVGGLVGEWLFRAASRMFTTADSADADSVGDAHGSIVRGGEDELTAVRPLITAFWQGYREVRPAADHDPGDPGFAERVVAFAGWHLFDRMLAGAMFGPKLTGMERGVAGVGRGALLSPERFVETIGLVEE